MAVSKSVIVLLALAAVAAAVDYARVKKQVYLAAMLGVLVSAVTSVLAYSLVLIVGLWCWFQWKKWDFLQAVRKLPCTRKALPFFGHIHLLLQDWEGISKLAMDVSLTAVSKGLYTVSFWLGPLPVVMIHKLEDVQKLLTTSCTAEKGDEMEYLKYALGNGLLTAPGHTWKITRRHISPLFHPRKVEQLMTTFNSNSRELVAELANHVDGKPVNMLHPTMSVALKTVCQLIFGTELDFDTQSVEFKGLLKVVELIPDLFAKRTIKPWLRIDSIFEFLYKKELDEMDYLWKRFTESPLKISKTNLENRSLSTLNENDDLPHEGTLNLVDVYTELQKKYPQFTDNDLKSEMVTLYCTGTDTIGLTVSSCLLVLSHYHDIQERVYEEINAVVGSDDDVTTDHISRMQYLDQVYKETLRWSIIVPYIVRKTSDELNLSTCTIPADNTVVVCLIGPHMDPTIYPEPQKFDPERFSPENSSFRSRHALIPFSSGSRMCIGKTYSEHLVKTMLVHVLRRYTVSTDMDIHNLKKILAVTLINSEGYNIKLRNRK